MITGGYPLHISPNGIAEGSPMMSLNGNQNVHPKQGDSRIGRVDPNRSWFNIQYPLATGNRGITNSGLIYSELDHNQLYNK